MNFKSKSVWVLCVLYEFTTSSRYRLGDHAGMSVSEIVSDLRSHFETGFDVLDVELTLKALARDGLVSVAANKYVITDPGVAFLAKKLRSGFDEIQFK